MSPITLGILAASGAATVGSYELITSTVLSSSAASITFSNLGTAAAAYKHLQIRYTGKNSSAGPRSIFIRFNGDSGTNYYGHQLYGSGSAVGSSTIGVNTSGWAGYTNGTDTASTIFNAGIIDILDFASTLKTKTTRSIGGEPASGYILFRSSAWFSTAAITSIVLSSETGEAFTTGSRFSLYGLRG